MTFIFNAHLFAGIIVCGVPLLAGGAEPITASVIRGSGCGRALAADLATGKTTTRAIAFGGSNRSFLLHLPINYDSAKPAPVVLNFHGLGSNPEQQNTISAFVPMSDREGFILVTPDGGLGWRFMQSARDANTAFVRDVVASVSAELCVDPKRVFAVGKSQGGFMASWLGCVAPEIVAAIAPVSGMYEPTGNCAPIPIMQFHGQADSTIPFGGGRVLVLGNYPGAVAVMEKWAGTNGCVGTPETARVTPHVQRVTYRDCQAATIQFITDAGHTWPGTTMREGDNSPPADLQASELIWDFFKTHPKK
ncbi:MAG: PHB depolymerase family esterase [Hyphomicrobium sp.]